MRRSALRGIHSARFIRVTVLSVMASFLPLWPTFALTLEETLAKAASDPQFQLTDTLPALYLANKTSSDSSLSATVGAIERGKPGIDQQDGAPTMSQGTTTVAEKPGLAELLNLAIERGAVTQTTSGTSYTLQTTPYLLYSKFGGADTKETWNSYAILRRIGISATFNQNSQDSGGGGDQTGSDFDSGEVKLAVLGSRSARDSAIIDKVQPALQSAIGMALNSVTADLQLWVVHHPDFDKAQTNFHQWLENNKGKVSKADIVSQLSQGFDKLLASLTPEDLAELDRLVASIGNEQQVRRAAVQEAITTEKAYLDAARPQLSLAYGFQRDATLSDYSTFKVLFAYKGSRLTTDFNGQVMVNQHLAAADGTPLERIRAYSAEAGLTFGKFAHDAFDLTAAASLMRPQGEARNMAVAQAKLNMYLVRGVTIPIAVTYANRTEQSDHSGFRFHVGFALNGDALLGVARQSQP